MKRNFFRTFVVSLGAALLAAAAAYAGDADHLVVNIPYDFVVAGQTLPAGSYEVSRANGQDQRRLFIRSYEKHASVFVIPTEIEYAPVDRASVSFQRVGNQHILTRIESEDHIFNFAPSAAAGDSSSVDATLTSALRKKKTLDRP